MPFRRIALLGISVACAIAASAAADGSPEKVEKKTVTVIKAHGVADGSSQISREAVKECIVALPAAESVEPEVTSDARYLKEINGEAGKNGWVKTYSARLVINYQVYKKDLLIVATQSVEGKEPTLREVEKRLPAAREFVSNPADGDTFAGRSNRQYYYTSPEAAAKDVKDRAAVWLKQQKPLLCGDMK